MVEALQVPGRRVRVPAEAVRWRAVRSSGPGGQNVNKVSSKVELRVEVAAVQGLNDAARERLRVLAGSRWTAGGEIVITCDQYRDQGRNLSEATARLLDLLERAATPPKPRRATRPTAGSRERRLHAKRARSGIKRDRSPGPSDD
jgi:ribosome-associated protein